MDVRSLRLDGSPRDRCPYCHTRLAGGQQPSGQPTSDTSRSEAPVAGNAFVPVPAATKPSERLSDSAPKPQPEIVTDVTIVATEANAVAMPEPSDQLPRESPVAASQSWQAAPAMATKQPTRVAQEVALISDDSPLDSIAANEPDKGDTTGVLVARLRRQRLEADQKLRSQPATTKPRERTPPRIGEPRQTASHCHDCGATLNRGNCLNSNCTAYHLPPPPPVPVRLEQPPADDSSSGRSFLMVVAICFLVVVKFLYFFYRGMQLW